MSPDFIERLNTLIANDELEKAIAVLQNGNEWMPETAREELVLLSGRIRQLKQKEVRGVVSSADALLEMNKIRNALLQMIQLYSKPPEELAKIALRKKLKWVIPTVLYLVVVTGLLWWFFQPQANFRMEAELLVERVSFTYWEGPGNFVRGKVQSCNWQNYQSMAIEGERVLLGQNGDQPIIPTSSIVIKADENIPGIGVRFGAATLERLLLEPGALLTLAQDEQTPASLFLSIQQATALGSEWTYQDSLEVEVEMAQLEGLPGLSRFYSPTVLRVFPPQGKAREMKMRSFPGTTNLEMQFEAGYQIEGKNLLIDNPGFYQPLESVAVPTLLGGYIRIGALGKPPLRNIVIAEGEALDISSADYLEVQSLRFGAEGISMTFNGEVERIETGRNHTLRNPSRLEWWWHSWQLFIIVLLVLVVGLPAFFLFGLQKRFYKKSNQNQL